MFAAAEIVGFARALPTLRSPLDFNMIRIKETLT